MTNEMTFRPETIADQLGLSGKIVRAHLRRTYPRPIESKGSTWVLSETVANEVLDHFRAKNPQNEVVRSANEPTEGGDVS